MMGTFFLKSNYIHIPTVRTFTNARSAAVILCNKRPSAVLTINSVIVFILINPVNNEHHNGDNDYYSHIS